MQSSKAGIRGALGALLAISGWGAQAQQAAGEKEAPSGIAAGATRVQAGADFAAGRDDNVFLSDTNKRSSKYRIFSPYARLEAAGRHKLDLGLRYDFGRYADTPSDNYDDRTLSAGADLQFTGRAGLRARAEYRHGHDPRGSTDRPFGERPDEYKHTGADGTFRYGAPGAQGRIEVDAGHYQRRYENNRSVTEAFDYDTSSGGATFFWRVAPRTELLFQGQRQSYDYELGSSTLDSDETRFYAGARWTATARTEGTVKFGHLKKDFVEPSRQDVSSSSWDVGVRWSPLTYSIFDFTTSRQTNESTGLGNTILTSSYGISWTHNWNSRLRTQLIGVRRNDEYQGATREDDTTTTGARITYQFRRWARFGVEYTHAKRDSDSNPFDYTRNLLLFSAGLSL